MEAGRKDSVHCMHIADMLHNVEECAATLHAPAVALCGAADDVCGRACSSVAAHGLPMHGWLVQTRGTACSRKGVWHVIRGLSVEGHSVAGQSLRALKKCSKGH